MLTLIASGDLSTLLVITLLIISVMTVYVVLSTRRLLMQSGLSFSFNFATDILKWATCHHKLIAAIMIIFVVIGLMYALMY